MELSISYPRKQHSTMQRPALWTVPPFVTAHTFCASRVWFKIFKFLKEFAYKYKSIFAQFLTMWKAVEKVDLNKGYQNLKRKS